MQLIKEHENDIEYDLNIGYPNSKLSHQERKRIVVASLIQCIHWKLIVHRSHAVFD
jgi:hypothetical protein